MFTVLDPYLLNIFPRSLLPTGIYLIILAVLAWYLSNYVSQGLHQISQIGKEQNATFDAPTAGKRSKKVN